MPVSWKPIDAMFLSLKDVDNTLNKKILIAGIMGLYSLDVTDP